MSILLPENLCRLQATCFVDNAEISAIGRSEILRVAAEKLAEQALRKLMRDCIKSRDSYLGFSGQTLELDVYVISPHELHEIIAGCIQKAQEDERRWRSMSVYE